jgi:hypothetical protein
MKSIPMLALCLTLASCQHTSLRASGTEVTSTRAARPSGVESRNNSCEIPGSNSGWEDEYCLWQVGTDDLRDSHVQACINVIAEDQTLPGDGCERNKHLKARICQIMIETGFFLVIVDI